MEWSAIKAGRPGRPWVLPPLPERGFPTFRVFFMLLLVMTAVLDLMGNRVNLERTLERPYGHLGISSGSENGRLIIARTWTEEGQRAGIRNGQTIVAIDGVAVGDGLGDLDRINALLVRPEGKPVTLTTRDADGTTADRRLTRRTAHVDAQLAGSGLTNANIGLIQIGSQLVADFFLLFVAALLMRARRPDMVGVLTATFLLLGVLTSAGPAPMLATPVLSAASRVFGNIGIIILTVALLAFPDGEIKGWFRKTLLVLFALVAIPSALNLGPSNAVMQAIVPILLLLLVGALIARARSLASAPEGLQVRTALFGFVTGLLSLIASGLLGQASRAIEMSDPALSTWLLVASILAEAGGIMLLAGGLLVSLLKYRLYQVEALISRSAALGVMTLGFVAAFAGLESVLQNSAITLFSGGEGGKIAGAISAAVAAALIVPMHRRINDWTERRFRKGLAGVRETLARDVDDLRETANGAELKAFVERRVGEGLHARWTTMIIGQGDGNVLEAGEFRVPLVLSDGRQVGAIEVGPRLDGSLHGKDEREAVEGAADSIARALWVVERRGAKEAALEARLRVLETAIVSAGKRPRAAN